MISIFPCKGIFITACCWRNIYNQLEFVLYSRTENDFMSNGFYSILSHNLARSLGFTTMRWKQPPIPISLNAAHTYWTEFLQQILSYKYSKFLPILSIWKSLIRYAVWSEFCRFLTEICFGVSIFMCGTTLFTGRTTGNTCSHNKYCNATDHTGNDSLHFCCSLTPRLRSGKL